MKKIEEYTIKRSESPHYLAEYVQEAINEGWQPFGTVFSVGCSSCQPMVKYKQHYVGEDSFEGTRISELSEVDRKRYVKYITRV